MTQPQWRRLSHRQIQAVVKRIAAEFNPERIIVFGSYAYGKPRPDSDVDLLITAPFDFAVSVTSSRFDGVGSAYPSTAG
jgi:predicted nucleotidyltransferase